MLGHRFVQKRKFGTHGVEVTRPSGTEEKLLTLAVCLGELSDYTIHEQTTVVLHGESSLLVHILAQKTQQQTYFGEGCRR